MLDTPRAHESIVLASPVLDRVHFPVGLSGGSTTPSRGMHPACEYKRGGQRGQRASGQRSTTHTLSTLESLHSTPTHFHHHDLLPPHRLRPRRPAPPCGRHPPRYPHRRQVLDWPAPVLQQYPEGIRPGDLASPRAHRGQRPERRRARRARLFAHQRRGGCHRQLLQRPGGVLQEQQRRRTRLPRLRPRLALQLRRAARGGPRGQELGKRSIWWPCQHWLSYYFPVSLSGGCSERLDARSDGVVEVEVPFRTVS